MQDIANKAEVGVATLFRYFPKKQMLIIAVANHILSEELAFYCSINCQGATGIQKVESPQSNPARQPGSTEKIQIYRYLRIKYWRA